MQLSVERFVVCVVFIVGLLFFWLVGLVCFF